MILSSLTQPKQLNTDQTAKMGLQLQRELFELVAPLADPEATADDVTAVIQALNSKAQAPIEGIDEFVWHTYSGVFEAVQDTPSERQGRLLDFVFQLRQTTVTDAEGKPVCSYGEEVWQDLPQFGWIARDLWNMGKFILLQGAHLGKQAMLTRNKDTKGELVVATEDVLRYWYNQTAFVAQLTARAVEEDPDDETLDFSRFGLWHMRKALEKGDKDRVPEADIQHAALWVRFAGERLRQLSADGEEMPARTGIPGSRYRDRGWKGFTEDRWRVWKDELKEAQGRVEGEGGELVRAAVEKMERL